MMSRRCWKLIDINCNMSKETQMSMQMLPVYWIVLVKCCRCSHNLCWLQKLCPNLRASLNHRRCDCCFPLWRHCIWPPLLFWLLVVVVCCCSECTCDQKCERVILHFSVELKRLNNYMTVLARLFSSIAGLCWTIVWISAFLPAYWLKAWHSSNWNVSKLFFFFRQTELITMSHDWIE